MNDEQSQHDHATTAQILQVSIRTLTNWRERGLIKATVQHQGLNPVYRYSDAEIAACRARVAELREQR